MALVMEAGGEIGQSRVRSYLGDVQRSRQIQPLLLCEDTDRYPLIDARGTVDTTRCRLLVWGTIAKSLPWTTINGVIYNCRPCKVYARLDLRRVNPTALPSDPLA